MNGSDRRRGSKWDTKEDGSPENRRGLARCNKTGSSFHEHESRDYMSGRRGLQRDFRMNEESMLGGGHYTRRTSPGPDGRRLQSRSRSPRRSRGRSYRSRSRSRSPAYNLQREPGVHRSSSKSGQSAPLCREFAAGRCKKGDLCRFSHHSSPNHDTWRHFESKTGDGWDSRRGNDGASRHHSEPYSGGRSTQICNEFLKGRCTRGVSCKYRHSGSNEFIEGATDASHRDGVNDWRSKSGSSYDRDAHIGPEPICKFFAAGNCRNGKHCKFSHQRDGQFNSERRSPDGRQPEHNSEGMNRVRNDRNWGDRSSLRRVPEASGWEIEESGFRDPQRSIAGEWSKDGLLNHELGDPTYTRGAASTGNEKMENIEHQSFQWKSNDVSVSETKALEKGLSEGKMLSPKGTFNSQSSDSLPFLQTSLSFGEQDTARRASAENTYLSGIMHNNVSGEYSQPKPSFPVDITPGARNNGSSHVNVNILGDIPHGQGLHQDGGLVAQPFSTVDTVGQSQTTFPLHPPGGEQMQIAHHLPVIDTNTAMGQCQSMFPPSLNQNQGMQMPHHQPVVDPNPADGAYVSTAGISQAAPGVDLSQNSGLNEQLAKYSHLSATLVQLLQNRQQLPQLYAAITQQTASALPVAAAPAQPIQASELTRQYDPIGDSLETKVGGSLAEQRSLLGESEIPSGGMTATGDPKLGPNGDDMRRKDHNLNVQGPAVVSDEENGDATGKGAHETQEALNQEGPTDDMALDSGADDVKKSKDAKGVRQFKFALAEYVKELLKPTWKGGQMSKEVYKTIVKKVVDKVTETIQPAHIPRTKEKIDQYLSASKPKLSKLVQAYLEKHHKT